MTTTESFKRILQKKIKDNLFNNYTDNWDYTLFGPEQGSLTFKSKVVTWLKRNLPQQMIYKQLFKMRLQPHLEGMGRLSDLFEDDYSRELLIQLLAHRLMGHKKIKLPLSNKAYWQQLAKAESLVKDKVDYIDSGFKAMKLYRHDLNEIGYSIQMYLMSFGILVDFIIKQYEFNRDGVVIKAEQNDVVIDAGGCWGDTALYFAHEVGEHGKVYSFEFIPGNIAFFNKNISINPALLPRIELVENPLWDKPGVEMYYDDFGPASTVSFTEFKHATGKTTTQTIDNLVKTKGLKKIDFIKMDIEGAEINSLKGARETLIAFKPKLAISVYHSLADFYNIAEYLDSLALGYKFYLAHYTIHAGETILYAKI